MATSRKRYMTNDATQLQKVEDPYALFLECSSNIIRHCPPSMPFAGTFEDGAPRGLFVGPTSIAYYFFWVSQAHPDLAIAGKVASEWCNAYLDLGQESSPSPPSAKKAGCGINSEFFAYNAVRACVTKDLAFVERFIEWLPDSETDPGGCEWMCGRAGALYMLRMMRHWFPESRKMVDSAMGPMIDHMIGEEPWSWHGKAYLGPAHGEIGIIVQIVLSDPSRASALEAKTASLLDIQRDNGNWPSSTHGSSNLVQWCHGAPGFVVSLKALRPYFPNLHGRIDSSVERAKRLIWKHGLLVKEPNICHGITGNALALDPARRDHFLTWATPDKIEKGVRDGIYMKEDESFGLLWGEAGRAWVWMNVADGKDRGVVLYTDI